MASKRKLAGGREDGHAGVTVGDGVDEDGLREAQLVGHRLTLVGGDGCSVKEDAQRVAAAPVRADEDAQHVEPGHRVGPIPARSSATRCNATTESASVMRPSRVIAKASPNGSHTRVRSCSEPSRAAAPWTRSVAR